MMNLTAAAPIIEAIRDFTEEAIQQVIGFADELRSAGDSMKPAEHRTCPRCHSEDTTADGRNRGKRRWICKSCGRSFGETTNTVMLNSQFDEDVWDIVWHDTVFGRPIDFTAGHLDISHETIFRMRHKLLRGIEKDALLNPSELGGIVEIDETFVLESYKGTKLPNDFYRSPRDHKCTAVKRGLSNEQISICTGVQRGADSGAFARTVNRGAANPSEVASAFGTLISPKTLVMCDGEDSYNVLAGTCGCSVSNYKKHLDENGAECFYHINGVNSFHARIKEQYRQYRGVATKYLNRYNALFCIMFKHMKSAADWFEKLTSGAANYSSTIKGNRFDDLLAV